MLQHHSLQRRLLLHNLTLRGLEIIFLTFQILYKKVQDCYVNLYTSLKD